MYNSISLSNMLKPSGNWLVSVWILRALIWHYQPDLWWSVQPLPYTLHSHHACHGEILPHFCVNIIFLAQKLTKLSVIWVYSRSQCARPPENVFKFWKPRGATETILQKMLYWRYFFTIFCILLTCFGEECKENQFCSSISAESLFLFNLLSYKFYKPI